MAARKLRKRASKGKKVAKVVGIVLVVAGLAVIPLYWDFPIAAVELPGAAEAYRKAGLPWDAKDLAPNPPVSESDNAAPLLIKACANLPKWTFQDEKDAGKDLKDGNIAKALVIVESAKANLALAHEAAKMPRLDFHRDWALGPELGFHENAGIRAIAKLLLMRAHVNACQHKVAEAKADLSDVFRIGSLVGSEPHPFPLGQCVSLETQGLTILELCQTILGTDGIQLREAARFATVPKLKPALLGQAFDGLSMYRNFGAFGPQLFFSEAPVTFDEKTMVRTGLPPGFLARGYLARYMQAWVEVKKGLDQAGDDPIAMSKVMDEVGDRMYNHRQKSYELAATAVPKCGDLGKKLVDLGARIQSDSGQPVQTR